MKKRDNYKVKVLLRIIYILLVLFFTAAICIGCDNMIGLWLLLALAFTPDPYID